MGTTVSGLPYPEPTDPVAAGAAAIHSLAEKTDERLVRIGLASVSLNGSGYGTIYFAKPFPAGWTPWALFQVYNYGLVAYQLGSGTPGYVQCEVHNSSNGDAAAGLTLWIAYIAAVAP